MISIRRKAQDLALQSFSQYFWITVSSKPLLYVNWLEVVVIVCLGSFPVLLCGLSLALRGINTKMPGEDWVEQILVIVDVGLELFRNLNFDDSTTVISFTSGRVSL